MPTNGLRAKLKEIIQKFRPKGIFRAGPFGVFILTINFAFTIPNDRQSPIACETSIANYKVDDLRFSLLMLYKYWHSPLLIKKMYNIEKTGLLKLCQLINT